ncbi:MAG: hypothetical protein HN353_08590 [Bdellovibrionales bacterium]|jgi:hypothetical protein|nr:hypothetical protein [Bdellovibrionales bacterium]MBT3526879.1 hypothetical protein [Bdellovibrionales bacterium]MBT7669702.1 hypothetical protein [Bdellovibrionales bacterium]MBT7765784.1 hypothetical protein [Bdellovibrionales bacterium]
MNEQSVYLHRILVVIKLDADRLFERISERYPEYIGIYSLKRTRDHFSRIFDNRFSQLEIRELAVIAPELNVALDNFYSLSEQMNWYLYTTEDLPQAMSDRVLRYISELKSMLETINIHIEAELSS